MVVLVMRWIERDSERAQKLINMFPLVVHRPHDRVLRKGARTPPLLARGKDRHG